MHLLVIVKCGLLFNIAIVGMVLRTLLRLNTYSEVIDELFSKMSTVKQSEHENSAEKQIEHLIRLC